MTNKTISLTIPNDDPIALHEFGAAMQRMAHSHGHPVVVPHEVAKGIMTERKAAIREAMSHDTDKAQLAALGDTVALDVIKSQVTAKHFEVTCPECDMLYVGTTDQVGKPCECCATADTTQSHLDSDGLPWDARIHASSKERNADDTWRARRKPSDMDAGQWAEFQGQVRTELRALMELPVEQEVAAVLDEQSLPGLPDTRLNGLKCSECGEPQYDSPYGVTCVNGHGGADGVDPTPVVVEPVEPEPIVVTPPPVVALPAPVEPVVPVAPHAPTGTGPTEFVPFLQWITSSGITPEQVNVALAQHGLTAVPQLQQRPDLIPQVHATLAAGV